MSIFLDDKKPIIEPENENTSLPAAEQTPAAGETETVETINTQAQEAEKHLNEQLEKLWSHGKDQLASVERPKQYQPIIIDTPSTNAQAPATHSTLSSSNNTTPAPQPLPTPTPTQVTENLPTSTTSAASTPQAFDTERPLPPSAPQPETTSSHEHSDLPAVHTDHPLVTQQENTQKTDVSTKKE